MSATPPTFLRAAAVTALLGSLAFASPVYAASSNAPAPSAKAPTGKSMHKSMEDRVETRIKTLHDKLKITPDQETAWSDVAQAMRDNEASIKGLIETRHQNAKTMTAVEDLESYQKITEAHAQGLTKVASAFSPLYDAMSDDQKKNADDVFGGYEGHRDVSEGAMPSSKKMSNNPESMKGE